MPSTGLPCHGTREPNMSLSRAAVRTAVASESGDLRRSHHVVPCTPNNFTDLARLVEEDNGYAGCDILFTGPDPDLINQVRYVVSSDHASGTLVFQPNVAVSIPEGQDAELYNYRGMGCTVA